MLRKRTWLRIYSALFLLALVGTATLTSFLGLDNNPAYHKNSAEDSEKPPSEGFWERATTDPVAFFTAILVVFNAVLAVATVKLWRSTDALVRGAERTAQQELRAYIHEKWVRFSDNPDPGTQRIEICLHNWGKTRAKHIHVKFHYVKIVEKTGHVSRDTPPPSVIPIFTLAPGAERVVRAVFTMGALDLAEAKLKLSMVVTYEDVFGRICTTPVKARHPLGKGVKAGPFSVMESGEPT